MVVGACRKTKMITFCQLRGWGRSREGKRRESKRDREKGMRKGLQTKEKPSIILCATRMCL